MKVFNKVKKLFVLFCVLVFSICIFPTVNVFALKSDNGDFSMRIMDLYRQGTYMVKGNSITMNNGEGFGSGGNKVFMLYVRAFNIDGNGNKNPNGGYPAKTSTDNYEYVYCIEPGQNTDSFQGYRAGSLDGLIQSSSTRYDKNSVTTWQEKKLLLGRLFSLIGEEFRCDSGLLEQSTSSIEGNNKILNYLAVQHLVWEIFLGERDENFKSMPLTYPGAKPIKSAYTFLNSSFSNQYTAYYNDYVNKMQHYKDIPAGSSTSSNYLKNIVLDKYDSVSGYYYTDIVDNSGVLGHFNFTSSSSAFTVSKLNSNTIRISATTHDVYSGTINCYNTWYKNAAGSNIQMHDGDSTKAQNTMSLKKVIDPPPASYYGVIVPNKAGIPVTLEVDPNGGTWEGSSSIQTFKGKSGEVMSIPTPTRDGYKFLGWGVEGVGLLDAKIYDMSKLHTPEIVYRGHSAEKGWSSWNTSGEDISTYSTDLQAVNITLGYGLGIQDDSSIRYKGHVSFVGDIDWVSEGGQLGYYGAGNEKKKLEAFSAELTGTVANYYDLEYRSYCDGVWSDWVKNGAQTGTTGQSKPLQNLQLRLVSKSTITNQITSNSWVFMTNKAGDTKGKLTAYWETPNTPPDITEPVEPEKPLSPTPSGTPPFVEGDQVVVMLGDPINPLDFVRADDKEDGDLTDEVVIVNDPIPRDEKGNTTVAGTYRVIVKVTDHGDIEGNNKLSDTDIVTVFVNAPPQITSTNGYYFVGDNVSMYDVRKYADARDPEEGIYENSKIKIDKILYPDGKEHSTSMSGKLDTSKATTFEVHYSVKDKYGLEAKCKSYIYVVDPNVNVGDNKLRYISKDFLYTLDPTSKWVKAPLSSKLNASLNKEATDSNAKYIIEISSSDYKDIKYFMENTLPTEDWYGKYKAQFGYTLKKGF